MKIANALRSLVSATRKSVMPIIAMLLILNICGAAFALPMQKGTNTGGVGRGDNGQILTVSVTLNGLPVAGARIAVAVGDGSVFLHGTTAKNGKYSAPLDAGLYTVTATSPKGKASDSVTIVQSMSPAFLTLTLAPPAK
jgi:hypothetical protein